jgi:hypothetical protein
MSFAPLLALGVLASPVAAPAAGPCSGVLDHTDDVQIGDQLSHDQDRGGAIDLASASFEALGSDLHVSLVVAGLETSALRFTDSLFKVWWEAPAGGGQRGWLDIYRTDGDWYAYWDGYEPAITRLPLPPPAGGAPRYPVDVIPAENRISVRLPNALSPGQQFLMDVLIDSRERPEPSEVAPPYVHDRLWGDTRTVDLTQSCITPPGPPPWLCSPQDERGDPYALLPLPSDAVEQARADLHRLRASATGSDLRIEISVAGLIAVPHPSPDGETSFVLTGKLTGKDLSIDASDGTGAWRGTASLHSQQIPVGVSVGGDGRTLVLELDEVLSATTPRYFDLRLDAYSASGTAGPSYRDTFFSEEVWSAHFTVGLDGLCPAA